ncbi:NAD(P)/FAD-dependent oxidoreductase [Paenarthrobacter aurescens]|nr:NAD(P)/FAD-dependent oxidoreductase [Paenarthrobacter aurescens]MDO6143642.1 FAD-dependent monooxygenase [Paenarthrobacter aurescens]MDO6147490.1 FAD-dependent monooxygenase [Paenarthrobacter aurescens]MDO6158733.1 FAD-dependent monooxygenase [Paenarthrobacter aurescens]MDO6162717.1 FAD-dependent monooxygenase [Paenarthrobacter aurescens]
MPDVVIVGAGPVGLFMGVLLLQRGHQVRILERRSSRSNRSRAIGIHPPALSQLAHAGVAGQLVSEGVRISRGVAYSQRRRVAGLAFDGDAGFPFILSVPQAVTEEVLELAVRNLDPGAIVRGAEVQGVTQNPGGVGTIANCHGGVREFDSRLVIAADGAHSAIRRHYLPDLPERTYPDCYIMGDFPDGTGHGSDAVLYLEPAGIVESFPLPGDVRRWVVRLGAPERKPTADGLAHLVVARTGEPLDVGGNSMLSAFEVRSRMAHRMVHGRVVLLGDAAHEISPIGGQGMNLGWLDAAALAPIIDASLRGAGVGADLEGFEKSRRKAALRASRQAGLNMALGRPLPPPAMAARNAVFATALAVPAISGFVERRFTMR